MARAICLFLTLILFSACAHRRSLLHSSETALKPSPKSPSEGSLRSASKSSLKSSPENSAKTPLPKKLQRDPAFFNLFSAPRPKAPALLSEKPASPLPRPPSALNATDIREMALFYERWAFQFQRAVQNYQSAAKEYKQAVRHFKKMSGHTKKRQDRLFFDRFQKLERNLRSADAFLENAERLRTTRPAFGRTDGAVQPP